MWIPWWAPTLINLRRHSSAAWLEGVVTKIRPKLSWKKHLLDPHLGSKETSKKRWTFRMWSMNSVKIAWKWYVTAHLPLLRGWTSSWWAWNICSEFNGIFWIFAPPSSADLTWPLLASWIVWSLIFQGLKGSRKAFNWRKNGGLEELPVHVRWIRWWSISFWDGFWLGKNSRNCVLESQVTTQQFHESLIKTRNMCLPLGHSKRRSKFSKRRHHQRFMALKMLLQMKPFNFRVLTLLKVGSSSRLVSAVTRWTRKVVLPGKIGKQKTYENKCGGVKVEKKNG